MPLKIHKRGGIWHCRGTIGPASRRKSIRCSLHTTDEDTAARQASDIESAYWKGHFDGPGAILTFNRAVDLYLAAGKSATFVEPIRAHLGNELVKDISPGMIRQMAMELYGHCSGASRNRLAIIPAQAIINHAADSELCQRIRVKRFKQDTKEKPHATLEWVQAFMKEASPQLGAYALLMFLTGARPTEALECEIDLPGRTVLLRESKIGHERRAHLQPMLVAALASLPKIEGRHPFFYKILDDLRYTWNAAVKRAVIQRMTPHSCRHGFITMLLRNGIDVKTAAWLADMTVEVLVKTYAHAIKDRSLTDVLTRPQSAQPDEPVDLTARKKA